MDKENSITIEAAKLLREFEREAIRNVWTIIPAPNNNVISLSGFTILNTPTRRTEASNIGRWYVKLSINGKLYDLEGAFDNGINVEAIANSILSNCIRELSKISY